MKVFKRLAAMGAAVMMMASVSAIGASAMTTKKVSFYISTSGSNTNESFTSSANRNGYYNTNFIYSSYSSKNVLILNKSYVIKNGKAILIIDGKSNNFNDNNTYISTNKNIAIGLKINNKLTFSPGRYIPAAASGLYSYI